MLPGRGDRGGLGGGVRGGTGGGVRGGTGGEVGGRTGGRPRGGATLLLGTAIIAWRKDGERMWKDKERRRETKRDEEIRREKVER